MNVNHVQPNAMLRAMSRNQLRGNWGMAILATFLVTLLSGLPQFIPIIGVIISIVIIGPLMLGMAKYFILLARGGSPSIETLFDGFNHFAPAFLANLLMGIFIFLWSLLLIIPGIIATLSYAQTFYILNDMPHMNAMDAIKKSKAMMRGYKGKLFLLHLSFLGWGLLCLFTLGIGFLWLYPYIQLSLANFYDDLKHVQQDPFYGIPTVE